MDSARHSDFTAAHAGVWRKLADDWPAMKSRCSAAEIGRSVRGVVTPRGYKGPDTTPGVSGPSCD